jgi:hypothetical protein
MLIEEQKANKENHIQNEMFDVITHLHTRPHITSQHTTDINTR